MVGGSCRYGTISPSAESNRNPPTTIHIPVGDDSTESVMCGDMPQTISDNAVSQAQLRIAEDTTGVDPNAEENVVWAAAQISLTASRTRPGQKTHTSWSAVSAPRGLLRDGIRNWLVTAA